MEAWRFEVDKTSTAGTSIGIPADVAVKTPQFPLLWMVVFGNATGDVTLLSSSKLMIIDIGWVVLMRRLKTNIVDVSWPFLGPALYL